LAVLLISAAACSELNFCHSLARAEVKDGLRCMEFAGRKTFLKRVDAAMARPFLSRLIRSWQFAFFLSLLLHAGLLWLCSTFNECDRSRQGGYPTGIDTRVSVAGMEVSLTLVETKPKQRASPQLPTQSQPPRTVPSPPDLIAKSKDNLAQAPTSPVRAWQAGMSEEQEEVAGSGGSGSAHTAVPGSRGPGTTSFFQITTQARTVVYVIDRSASMGLNGSWAAAKRELLASLQNLPADARFQVVLYNRSAEPLHIEGTANLAPATRRNKQCVEELLDGLRAEGGTDHLSALKRALSLRPEVIFFLTDADDFRSEHIRAITEINHGRAVIHTIELSGSRRTREQSALQILAQENRGSYQLVSLER
jgi:hypothetical protein